MNVVFRPRAENDLAEIHSWIGKDDRNAADRVLRRLRKRSISLESFSARGLSRPDIGDSARSLTEGRYPILYRVAGNVVEVVRFVHGVRDLDGLIDG